MCLCTNVCTDVHVKQTNTSCNRSCDIIYLYHEATVRWRWQSCLGSISNWQHSRHLRFTNQQSLEQHADTIDDQPVSLTCSCLIKYGLFISRPNQWERLRYRKALGVSSKSCRSTNKYVACSRPFAYAMIWWLRYASVLVLLMMWLHCGASCVVPSGVSYHPLFRLTLFIGLFISYGIDNTSNPLFGVLVRSHHCQSQNLAPDMPHYPAQPLFWFLAFFWLMTAITSFTRCSHVPEHMITRAHSHRLTDFSALYSTIFRTNFACVCVLNHGCWVKYDNTAKQDDIH